MARNINSVREAELSAALHGAFIASPKFLCAFLQNIGVPHPEDVDHIESSLEYVTADTGSRIDIYLWRDDPPLVVGIEVKRSEGGIRESQIRDYLSQMKITQQDGRLQRRRDAPRNAKLVVITGGTESPEEIEHVKIASSGTLESYIQWISWYRIVDILDEVIAEENLRSLTYLSNKLSDLGYVAINASLPALKTYQQVLSNILAIVNNDSIKSELEVLATTLNRVEYEMGKLNYGLTLRSWHQLRCKLKA